MTITNAGPTLARAMMQYTTKDYIGVDFETYSGTDIRRHGLDRYVSDPDFTPLIASIKTPTFVPVTFDFIRLPQNTQEFLDYLSNAVDLGAIYVAHNAGFERAVLRHMGMEAKWLRAHIVDSAVISRCQGGGSHLETAAPQLADINKLDSGLDLIRIFSIPNEWNGHKPPTWELIEATKLDEWNRFIDYCERDAEACAKIARMYPESSEWSSHVERYYEQITAEMNEVGWKVDLDLVVEMQQRYRHNVQMAELSFRERFDQNAELNFASPIQLKEWCAQRGIRATSFDEEHVAKLLKRLLDKTFTMDRADPKFEGYCAVREMLHTKQIIGGSSLKKLQTILDQVGTDGRLRNSYMHAGAGQSYRTSGRGVQMQNLKRLGGEVFDVEELLNPPAAFVDADNELLAENLRQVFTATDPKGELIVGDFSSVESRGLAWLAGAEWKLDAYRHGKDLYKVLAGSIYGIEYDQVDKAQRQVGKVGELSCGYGAGSGAVSTFAKNMGVTMSEAEAQQLVYDWRDVNPEIVDLWTRLDEGLHRAIDARTDEMVQLAHGLQLWFLHIPTPVSLIAQHAGAQSMRMELRHNPSGSVVLQRVFHGMYNRGRNVCYYKPSERKTGDLWSGTFVDIKTKVTRFHDVYGGKLAGILTQSFCRELFFMALERLTKLIESENLTEHARIVGQFHDEIVVDWTPSGSRFTGSLEHAVSVMRTAMTSVDHRFMGFPLEADIKHAYRYIK